MKRKKHTNSLTKPISTAWRNIILGCGVVLAIVAYIIARQFTQPDSPKPSLLYPTLTPTSRPQPTFPTSTPTPTIVPLTYLTYENSALGIRIQYPSVGETRARCVAEPTYYEHSKPIISLESSDTPTQIIEDLPNNALYLTFTQDGYVDWNQDPQKRAFNTDPKACHVVNVDLAYLKNGLNTGGPFTHDIYNTKYNYAFVHNDDELAKYLDNKFGVGCYQMSKILLAGKSNEYDLRIQDTRMPY